MTIVTEAAENAISRVRPLLVDPEFEARTIDVARRLLDDTPECRDADYAVRWVNTPAGPMPILVIAFHLPTTDHQPALAVSLVTVRKGSLLEVLPGNTILEGQRLRDHILRSAHDYLNRHGIKLVMLEPPRTEERS